mgnify:CR=1 FL=1
MKEIINLQIFCNVDLISSDFLQNLTNIKIKLSLKNQYYRDCNTFYKEDLLLIFLNPPSSNIEFSLKDILNDCYFAIVNNKIKDYKTNSSA